MLDRMNPLEINKKKEVKKENPQGGTDLLSHTRRVQYHWRWEA